MSTIQKDVLGFEVPVVGVADSLAELAQLAGSEQRALDFANNYVIFHKHLGTLRTNVIDFLVKATGIPQLTEKDGDKDVVCEKDTAYIARLEEQLGEGALNQYATQIADMCSKISVDYKVAVRGVANTTPAKKWLAAADELIKSGKLDAFNKKFGIELSEDADEQTVLITVANKLREIVLAKQREAIAAAVSV